MLFVTLAKMRGAMDEEFGKKSEQFMKNPPAGIKIHQVLQTLGRYDVVIFYEAPSEKAALLAGMFFADKASTETLVAIPQEEAKKLRIRR
jgi:uncharacterized protein with GYD domain